MKITVKQLLHVLPMDETVRLDILSKFDSMTEDQKLEIREFCWALYFNLVKKKIKFELDKALLEVKDGKRELTSDMYSEISKNVNKEFKDMMRTLDEKYSLDSVRKQLQTLR